MCSVVFVDTHAFVKRLMAVGFTEEQAEVIVEARVGLIENRVTARRDIKALEPHLEEFEERLIDRLTLRLGSMLVVAISIVAALVKVL